jgi:hypothetical protein
MKGLACALIFACLTIMGCEQSTSEKRNTMGLQILQVPTIILETEPVTRTETISIQKQDRLNPFRVIANSDSKLEVEATYRHRVELNETWSFVFDPNRGVAFIIMPDLMPTSPVEFKIIQDKKVIGGFDVDSSWFWKFEDQKQIQERMELLNKLNLELVVRASSTATTTLRVDEARQLVESHIREWLIKEGHCKTETQPVVKVFRKDEFTHFPLPAGAVLAEFIPSELTVE